MLPACPRNRTTRRGRCPGGRGSQCEHEVEGGLIADRTPWGPASGDTRPDSNVGRPCCRDLCTSVAHEQQLSGQFGSGQGRDQHRPVGRPCGDHPGDPGPQRRGGVTEDRSRARRPQVDRVPAGRRPRATRSGRAERRPRQVPPRHRHPAPGRRHDLAARPRPGEPRPSAGRWPQRPARRSTSRCCPTARRCTWTRSPAPRALQPHNWVGQRIPLHATSNGKVLLSGLTSEQVATAGARAARLHRQHDHAIEG